MNVAFSITPNKVHRIAVSVFFFVAGFTFATWASRIPDIKTKLQLTEAGLGAILFALPAGQIVSMPLTGWLVSKFGSQKLVITAAIIYPFILVLLALAAQPWHLATALFLFGLWANIINIAMNTQAVAVEELYGRSIMASFHGLWSLAGFSGAALGSLFVSTGIPPLVHFSIIIGTSLLLVSTAYKYTLPQEKNTAAKPLFVKPDSRILLLGIIAFCCMVCEGAMADWSGVYFQKIVHAPAGMITLGYVAFTATMATGRFLGDWLITKAGIKQVLQLSGSLMATGLLTAVLFPHLYTATFGFLLVGFGVSCVVPLVYSLAGKSTTLSPEMALTAVSTISFLGFLIGPPLIGFIAQAASLRWSFTIIALLGLGTSLLSGKVKT